MNLGDLRTARRLNMRSGSASWYHIGNTAAGGAVRVDIYDEIGFWGVMAQDFVRDIANVRGDIELHINSPGGDVFDGIAIYNSLLQHRGDVSVMVDGLAASAASFIAQAARRGKLKVAKTATMMIHNGFGLVIGDARDMRKMADVLDSQTRNIASIYAERTGKPVEHWQALMDAETWLIGQDAVDASLADGVLNMDAVSMGNWDLSVFRNAPAPGQNRLSNAAKGGSGLEGHGSYSGRHEHEHPSFDGMGNSHSHGHLHEDDANHRHDHGDDASNAASVPYVGRQETRHIPMTGRHEHDHAAFGSPDHDDGVHHHAHSHTGDASHDHTHSDGIGEGAAGDGHGAVVGAPGNQAPETFADLFPEWMRAGNVTNAAYDDSEWDGPAAMSAAVKSDDPAKALAAICAGRRSGPADEEESYALPHHKTPSSPPNRAGVNNAKSRLPGTKGLTNASAAESHLNAHQKLWADSDASDSATGTWQDAATRVGSQMAELLRGRNPAADAPQGGE